MPDIQTTDVGRKLQRRYQLLGPPPSPFLSPELVPVVLVDDLTNIDILESTFERPCWGTLTVTAAAGFAPHLGLVNPAGSGVVAVVELVQVFAPSTAQNYDIQVVSGLTANAFTHLGFRDSRIVGTPACALLGLNNVAATGINKYKQRVEANKTWDTVALNWVVAEGFGLRLRGDGNNLALSCNFIWRERPVETG